MTKEAILKFLAQNKGFFKERYGVRKIALFGSYARDEATDRSDIDIIVDMPSSFENYFELKYYLEEYLNMKVDLVKEKNIRAFIKDKIEQELMYV